eukprot:2698_1
MTSFVAPGSSELVSLDLLFVDSQNSKESCDNKTINVPVQVKHYYHPQPITKPLAFVRKKEIFPYKRKTIDDTEEHKVKQHVVAPQGLDDATRHFYNFLKDNKLDKYFHAFKANECCDIRDVEYLVNDTEFLKNDIGINNPIHRKKLMGEIVKLKKEMDEFNDMNIIPIVLMHKLLKHGIVTLHILCTEIQQKSDLQQKLGIQSQSQRELLWNIIDLQNNPKHRLSFAPRIQLNKGENDHLILDDIDQDIDVDQIDIIQSLNETYRTLHPDD